MIRSDKHLRHNESRWLSSARPSYGLPRLDGTRVLPVPYLRAAVLPSGQSQASAFGVGGWVVWEDTLTEAACTPSGSQPPQLGQCSFFAMFASVQLVVLVLAPALIGVLVARTEER